MAQSLWCVVGLVLAVASDAQVPIGLLTVAGESPWVFGQYLAVARVRAGLVLEDVDVPQSASSRVAIDASSTVSAHDLVAAFNRRHPTYYEAAVVKGVVVIRPASGLPAYLRGPAPGVVIRVRGIMNALRKVFAPLNAALDRPGAQIGSGLGGIGFVDRSDESVEVSIDGTGRTVLDILDEIAREEPAQVWYVETSREPSHALVRVGLIHRDGAATFLDLADRK